jgi:hypothetical protein
MKKQQQLDNGQINQIWCIVLLLVTILFIGLRDPWGAFEYFGDTRAYSRAFENIFYIDAEAQKDIGFYYLMKFGAWFLNLQLFYLLCAFLYVFSVYATFKKWFADNTIYALAIYIAAMSFWAFGVNGVRNGLGVSCFIFALGNINKKWIMILFMLLSVSMHKSMLLPIVVYFGAYFIKKPKWSILIWSVSIIVCLVAGRQLQSLLITNLTFLDDARIETYGVETLGMEVAFSTIRFRFDFILYSAVAILLGWFYVVKKGFQDKFYIRLLNTYILTNAAWIACFMYAAFTNRYAYLSWCIMPIVMIYPLLKKQLIKNQYRFIAMLIFGSLLFTLIMFFK